MPEEERADHRARAGATKRSRTRVALLAAATERFETQGWAGTRMEDVAAAAGVSAATAYNHFPTKHALVGAAFEPVLSPVTAQVQHGHAAGLPAVELLVLTLRGAATATHAHANLTASFIGAVQDAAALRSGRPPDPTDPNDPRSYVPLPGVVAAVITEAQRRGELRSFPPGSEIGASMINLLLLRVMNRREEPADMTAEIVLTLLLGALQPELLVEAGPDGRPFAAPPG